jgi:hypothetical protein
MASCGPCRQCLLWPAVLIDDCTGSPPSGHMTAGHLHHGIARQVALRVRLRRIAQVVSLATCLEERCSTCKRHTVALSAQIKQVNNATPPVTRSWCHLQGL